MSVSGSFCTLSLIEGIFAPDAPSRPLRSGAAHALKEVVLSDPEFRLGRPRLARLSAGQQAEAVELLARLLLQAARDQQQRRPRPRLRRAVPNTRPRRRS